MDDYLVVGLGLAGIAFCHTLEQHGKSFRVIDSGFPGASKVAGGIYNPVVLKRLNRAWKAHEQLPLVGPFYDSLEQRLQAKFHYSLPVFRRFATPEEQNMWLDAADSPSLRPFLSGTLVPNQNPFLNAPHGLGEVRGTGRVDTGRLLETYRGYLQQRGCFHEEKFNYKTLRISKDHMSYGAFKFDKLVFATGFDAGNNPYFGHLPIQGNKGEYLEIHSPELQLSGIIKGPVFLIPLGEDRYSVGATYSWKDHSPATTMDARNYLKTKLDELVNCSYRITGQVAGIRPTVPDRRPLLGRHPLYKSIFILNGFGSRGVMLAPYAALQLFNLAEQEVPLDPEIDILRYQSLITP